MSDDFDLQSILREISGIQDLPSLEKTSKRFFAKTGYFTLCMQQLVKLSKEDKQVYGKALNEQKKIISQAIAGKKDELTHLAWSSKLKEQYVDLSLPAVERPQGSVHPISFVIEQIIHIFAGMGFVVKSGPEIEQDWYNFTALNIPLSHPSRQDHDTFYLNSVDEYGNRKLLRTHTSNVQIRTMLEYAKNNRIDSIKFISPGRTYRSDSDATHSPMFHQVEGLFIAKRGEISVSLLRAILQNFCRIFFENDSLKLRLRHSYFPFTAPSYEIDVNCDKSKKNLVIGEGDDWMEILGSGIVHPKVLENCGIDSNIYAGLAFGMGVERLVMLKHGFKDLRSMFEGSIQWLRYYGVSPIRMTSVFTGL